MRYRYRAINREGKLVSGKLRARHPEALRMRLQQQGLEILEFHALRNWPLWPRPRLPRHELINFCFHLEQLCRAGVPLHDALRDLCETLAHAEFQEIIGELLANMEAGQSFSAALAQYPEVFSPTFTSLIHAGEISGQLPEMLGKLCASLKADDEFAAHTQKLLIYPALVSLVILSAAGFLMHSLVPQLKSFVQQSGHTWPWHSRLLFATADLIKEQGIVILMVLAGLVGSLAIAHARSLHLRALADRLKLRLPLVGKVLLKILVARLASSFALLYAAGVPVLDALRTSRDIVGNQHLASSLQDIEARVAQGSNLANAFASSGLFPALVIRMLRIGENTGELDRALQNLDYFYQRDVREAMAKVQALIEPAMSICLGLLLGWIMLALIGPLYDIVGGIKA